jgi:D-glycero-D-manno-heptose 1,7-bisphosphate phosphatase
MMYMPHKNFQRAVFLDRDGVICVNRPDHVKSWNEFQFLPAVKKSLAALSRLDLPIIVVTNQALINRGIVPVEVVNDIHQRMIAEVTSVGGRIDEVLYCPHRPDEGCSCRKPEPGLLWQAAERYRLDLSHSYLIGDAATDIMAGNQVGCRTFLVLTGRGPRQIAPAYRAAPGQFKIVSNLMEAAFDIAGIESRIKDRYELCTRDRDARLGTESFGKSFLDK